MSKKRYGLPGAVKYCLWANRITLLSVLGVIGWIAYGQYLDIQEQGGGWLSMIGLFSKLFGSLSMIVTFGFWILGLNSKLKQMNEKAMKWQVFWSFLFIFAFPIGTLLHLPCLYFMLFKRELYEAFEEGAWNDPKPVAGLMTALLVIGIAGGVAYFLWTQRELIADIKSMNPLSGMSAKGLDVSKLTSGKAGSADGLSGMLGGIIPMDKISKRGDGANHMNKLFTDLGLGNGEQSSASDLIGGLTGKSSGGNISSSKSSNGKSSGGFAALLGGDESSEDKVKQPYAMKTSKSALKARRANYQKKTLAERFLEWIDKKFINKDGDLPAISTAKSNTSRPVFVPTDEDTLYDKESGNVYF